ncbi:reverse transcriptase domain-containing protein [Tanacetum coccineum]|uniref:Reverse transcriptase domain-containing protein n=1 Tax=Tanacetum coccineum TaxID=301880 RepID=A0ABQ5IAX2_9ASTR
MAANGNGDDGLPPAVGGLPVPDLRMMKELCQPTLNGQGVPIALIAIQATNFGLKNDMIQQVQNSCPFRRPGDDANKHFDKFLHVTQSMKVNGVSDDALCLYLFPYSLQHRAAEWFDRLPRNSITTFDQMAKIFLGKYFLPSMRAKLRNNITNFRQEPDESLFEAWERYKLSIDRSLRSESYSSITSSNPEIAALKVEMAEISKNLMKMLQTNQQVNSVTPSCETCGGPHSYINCPATVGQTQNIYAAGAYNQVVNTIPTSREPANDAILKNMQTNMTTLTNSTNDLKNMLGQFMKMNTASTSGSRTLPSNTITNPREDLKGITTRSGVAYKGPMIPTTSSSPKVVERKTEMTKDTVPPTNNGGTKDVSLLSSVFLCRDKNQVCLLCEVILKQIPAFNFFCASLESIIAIENTWEWEKRPFLRTARALIDVHCEQMTLRHDDQSIIFKVGDTKTFSHNIIKSVKRIDVIDVAYEEYAQEVLGFSDTSKSGNPTPTSEPIVSTSSPTLTPFGDSDFLLEETDAFLAIEDELISPEINDSYYDSEGDILLLEEFLNDDPSSSPLPP